jgi:D-aminoacyl-tRNA deacylase
VDSQVVSSIGHGLCVFIGVGTGSSIVNVIHLDDSPQDAEALAKKILSLRLFNDESQQHMWKRSVKDIDGEILCGWSVDGPC